MLSRKNKNITKIIVICLFICLFISSNIFLIDSISLINGDKNSLHNDKQNLSTSATIYDLSDYFVTGSGNSLEARTYAINQSSSYNNLGSFNINAPTSPMRLSNGQFNFSFQNNYTTEYVIEEDSALYPIKQFENYKANYQAYNLVVGSILTGSFDNIHDNNPNSLVKLASSGNSLDFSIKNSFAGLPGKSVPFDRNNIMGIIANYTYSVDETVDLTLYMKNASDASWSPVISGITLNSSAGIESFNEIFINKNLNFINYSDISEISFNFSASNPFQFDLREFSLNSTMGFELNISSQQYPALEFDLRGESTRVNGFSAWIRTLNLTAAAGKMLNISLYKANGTITRNEDNLRNLNGNTALEPNKSELIDSKLFSYHDDDLVYFDFNLDNTANLSFFNYFIVIKSDAPLGTYTLVTIPGPSNYGSSGLVAQQLKTTNNDGIIWSQAEISQGGITTLYLDASSFKLNITRGYMPSDFNGTLKLENIHINNKVMTFYPFSQNDAINYGNKEWGKGMCNDIFSPHIDDISSNFQLDLNWNSTITNNIEFNVSYYVSAYVVGVTTTTYKVKYNGTPEWSLNYTLNTNIGNWNYTEFWYVYPNDMDAHNLTDPNYNEILANSTSNEIAYEINSIYDKVIVHSNVNGIYSLNLTSTNYLSSSQQIHSYINYNGTLWETKGFMYGDNISVRADIQDQENKAPVNGEANVSLFIDNGYDKSLISPYGNISDDNSFLYYYFGNQSILEVDSSVIFNKDYYLGYFWTNGTAIGCRKSQIFIDNYSIDYVYFNYKADSDSNQLYISPKINGFKYTDQYNLLIGTVNETGIASKPSYPVSLSDLNQVYTYNNPLMPDQLNLRLNSFKQSEDILNPGENVNFKVELENLEESYNLKLKVKVQLVSYANDQWIIAEGYSGVQTLDTNNSGGEQIKEFDVNLSIPSYDDINQVWYGINAPIRKGGAKTIVTIYYVDKNEIFGVYKSNQYSLLINEDEANFEGYIVDLIDKEGGLTGALINFPRSACLYNQTGYDTTVIANYYTSNYTSFYNDFIDTFSFKMNSIFDNIATIPSDINDVDVFNLTSTLKTEFGEILSGKTVICQYENDTGWFNITDPEKITDSNGKSEFIIDTNDLSNISDNFKIRLIWEGNDTINSTIQEEQILRHPLVASLSITLVSSNTIYKQNLNDIKLRFLNTGQVVLSIFKENITAMINEFGNDISLDIFYKSSLQNLAPGQSVLITIQFDFPNTNLNIIHLNISVNIEELSEKNTIISLSAIYPLFPPNISLILLLLIIAIIILSWIGAVLYTRYVKIKIRKSLKAPAIKERPRRGRYVKPSELLPPPKIKEKEIPKLEEKPIKIKKEIERKKTTTDLDTLLAETGIEKEVKKPQFTRSALKKWNLDKLRNYCKENNIKYSSKSSKSDLIDKILSKNKK